MIALYIPMQPSSNTPMIAFPERKRRAIFSPYFRAAEGILTSLNFKTCEVSCFTFPFWSHSRRFLIKNLSLKSSLQRVLYFTPALVRLPFKFSNPTKPGHVPLQFAAVSIGPWCEMRPPSRCCVYCQTASAATSGASCGIDLNTRKPIFWESMNPCPLVSSNGCARLTLKPSR
jgi:hypothetical protein